MCQGHGFSLKVVKSHSGKCGRFQAENHQNLQSTEEGGRSLMYFFILKKMAFFYAFKDIFRVLLSDKTNTLGCQPGLYISINGHLLSDYKYRDFWFMWNIQKVMKSTMTQSHLTENYFQFCSLYIILLLLFLKQQISTKIHHFTFPAALKVTFY